MLRFYKKVSEETKKFDLSNRLFIALILSVVVTLAAVCVIAYNVSESLSQSTHQQLTVTGEGKAYAKPDIASVNVALKTEGKNSGDVVNENNTKMNNIIKAIKALGIEAKDIQTSSYNLTPQYNWTEKQGRVFTGYELDQQITVTIRDFGKISDVLDKATSNGANTIGELVFSIENPEKAKSEARDKAIAQAKQKAQEMAKAAGMSIKLINITEGYSPSPVMYNAMKLEASAPSVGAAPDIQTGQQEIDVTINLTYQVN